MTFAVKALIARQSPNSVHSALSAPGHSHVALFRIAACQLSSGATASTAEDPLTCLVARAGIEPATFRFSGGVTAYATLFQLVRAGCGRPAGRAGVRGPQVWPHFGPMNSA